MSFRYKSQTITLDNYKDVFKKCPPDILDEIRSAILDDTSISQFIKPCGYDSYKLGQLRLCVREMIPVEFLNPRLTGKTLYNIRQGYAKGRDMSELLKYFNSKGTSIDKETIEKLSEFLLIGVDISHMDFKIVPTNLVDIVCKGLYQGCPMWLIIDDGCTLDEGMVSILMRGLSLGVDVQPFLNGDWKKEVLLLLFSYAKSVDLNDALRYITNKFDTECVRVLLDIASRGIPISQLCIKDTEGIPVYNSYQMYELGKALEEGVAVKAMFNANLSDFEIQEMREKEIAKRDRKLNVSLSKKY